MKGTNQNGEELGSGAPRRNQQVQIQRHLRRMVLAEHSERDVVEEAMLVSGIPDAQFFQESIDRLVRRGLLVRTDNGTALTESGVTWIRDTFYRDGEHFAGKYLQA